MEAGEDAPLLALQMLLLLAAGLPPRPKLGLLACANGAANF